jgi:hypothetical protein
MARATGLEPATSGVTGRHSNQLSYARAGRLGRGGRQRGVDYGGSPKVSSAQRRQIRTSHNRSMWWAVTGPNRRPSPCKAAPAAQNANANRNSRMLAFASRSVTVRVNRRPIMGARTDLAHARALLLKCLEEAAELQPSGSDRVGSGLPSRIRRVGWHAVIVKALRHYREPPAPDPYRQNRSAVAGLTKAACLYGGRDEQARTRQCARSRSFMR